MSSENFKSFVIFSSFLKYAYSNNLEFNQNAEYKNVHKKEVLDRLTGEMLEATRAFNFSVYGATNIPELIEKMFPMLVALMNFPAACGI